MPEYGRNIQLMIQHIGEIEDDEERQAYAEKVVGLMSLMNPRNKQLEDHIDKLWKHFFHIGDYKVNVLPPSGEAVTLEENTLKPEILGYPHHRMRFRHYGFYIQRMIKSAMEMEDEDKRDGYFRIIGSYMKLAYKTWNREHYVSDDIIKEDLQALTEGKYTFDEDTALDILAAPVRRKPQRRNNSNNYRNNRNSGGRNNYRNNRNG